MKNFFLVFLCVFGLLCFKKVVACENQDAITAHLTAKNYFLERKYIFAIEKALLAKQGCPDFEENNQLIKKIQEKLHFFEKNNLLKDSLDFDFIMMDAFGNKKTGLLDTTTRAMMYKNGYYFLVDKTGKPIEKYGTWHNITEENYFELGFLLVEDDQKQRFLITDKGEKLVYADDITQVTPQTQALDLSNRYIATLPDIIFSCTNLVLLNIAGTTRQQLPQNIKKLKNLRYFITGNNPFYELPQELALLSGLEVLDISISNIEKLPDFLQKFQNLRFLDISMTKINDFSVLKTLKNLKIKSE